MRFDAALWIHYHRLCSLSIVREEGYILEVHSIKLKALDDMAALLIHKLRTFPVFGKNISLQGYAKQFGRRACWMSKKEFMPGVL